MNKECECSTIEVLAWRVCTGELSPGESAELAELLRSSEEARRVYLECLNIHAGLCCECRPVVELPMTATSDRVKQEETLSNVPSARLPTAKKLAAFLARPTPLSVTIAAMVMIALITGMSFIAAPIYWKMTSSPDELEEPVTPPNSATRVFARLSKQSGAVWADGQVGTHNGAHLPPGHRMELLYGQVEVVYNDGTSVVLEGPATYTVDAARGGTLSVGKLSANVAPGTTGFSIRTPTARVVDLGTSFGVLVEQLGRAHVYVFEGVVEVRSSGRGTEERVYGRLTSGEAMLVDLDGTATPFEPTDSDRFIRPGPFPELTVSSARVAAEYRLFDRDGDGKGDSAHGVDPWPEVGIGEANDNVPDRGNGKYWIAFELPDALQAGDSIETAFVRFTPARTRHVQGLHVQLAGLADSNANATPADFERTGQPLGRVMDEHTGANYSRTADVTEFVRTEVAKGNRMVVFCLQVEGQSLPNNDKRSNCFLIYNSSAADPQQRPMLMIQHQTAKAPM